MEFQFCPHCMAYKRMRWVSPLAERIVAALVASVLLGWLLTRGSIHWTSWVLAAIVFPMTVYFGWPRKNRLRCEGCGKSVHGGKRI
ncbi:MAG: hypothetical protein ACE5HV_08500 [Acidobacteriota bacterium]